MKHTFASILSIATMLALFPLATRAQTEKLELIPWTATGSFSFASQMAGLALGLDGNFYGTTELGGSSSFGSVFRVTPGGAVTTVASFQSGAGGVEPVAGLTLGTDGSFYGVTQYGGLGYGTVFRVTTNGVLSTVVSLPASGTYPVGNLALGRDGAFYGTTPNGSSGYGTAFRVTTNGALTTLAASLIQPYAGLTLAGDGNFYGLTEGGGATGPGTVFRITTNGVLTTISFGADQSKYAMTLGNSGALYGTSASDAFQVTTNGALTKYSPPYGGGIVPSGGLCLCPDGNFYGLSANYIYRVTTNGVFTTLASFAGLTLDSPVGKLVQGRDGNYYGTANGRDAGVFFRLGIGPVITNQPQSQTVYAGNGAALSVAAYGGLPLAYQWRLNGTNLPGATNSALVFANAAYTNQGLYSVIITNAFGSATSSVSPLTVLSPPKFTTPLASQTVVIGNPATFLANATGSAPLTYQWSFNNGVLPGATNATLSFYPALLADAGNYQVAVVNPYGSATSQMATLMVIAMPNAYALVSVPGVGVSLSLASIPGSTNRVWATTNFSLPAAQWQPVATNVADANGLFQFNDTNASQRVNYYRVSTP